MSGLFDVDVLPSGEVVLRFEDGTRSVERIPRRERAIVGRSMSRNIIGRHGEGGILRSDRYLEELRAVQQAIEPPAAKPRPARPLPYRRPRRPRRASRTCQEAILDDAQAFADAARGDPSAHPYARRWRTCQNPAMKAQALCWRHGLQALRYLIWLRLTVNAYQG